jgi:hypothetical protein
MSKNHKQHRMGNEMRSRVIRVLTPCNAILKDAQVTGAGPAPAPRARWRRPHIRLYLWHIAPARPRGMRDTHHLTGDRIRHRCVSRDAASRRRGCERRTLRHQWRSYWRHRGWLGKSTSGWWKGSTAVSGGRQRGRHPAQIASRKTAVGRRDGARVCEGPETVGSETP